MEAIIKRVIKENQELQGTRAPPPWTPDQPHPQSFYTYDKAKQVWQAAQCKSPQEARGPSGINRLALFSWNIDFMLPYAKERMDAGLAYLDGLTSKLPPTTAAVIYLQECKDGDLRTIGEAAWVREKFNITDIDGSNWAGSYGTTTLVDRRLDVTACFRVHYAKTIMERDAFFVDVALGNDADGKPKTIRLCNSHLESLAYEPPCRPPQMKLIASFMKAEGVDGALAAGDFNAIQPFDRHLHSDNGLKDAYLELGGAEDSDDGYTWGQQAATSLRERFGCSRMDKVYFTGCVKLHRFERFGADVQLSDPAQREHILDLGFEKPWITDHMGVMAEVEIE
ncbi:Endonuclease/exonuclease/phosphatase [Hypomontagnella submonticulosa]|nr:Endonuclease/exonuclease/phosphatase [Hypomontagnella submonticulosa]